MIANAVGYVKKSKHRRSFSLLCLLFLLSSFYLNYQIGSLLAL